MDEKRMTDILRNYQTVLERISQAAVRAGRKTDDIQIVAVSKTHPVGAIIQAYDAGIVHFGESKVQEAEGKFNRLFQLKPDLKIIRHLVGHLQSNKVKKALALFDIIHSVDSLHLGKEISIRAAAAGTEAKILLQVNTSGEASKYGASPDQAPELAAKLAELPGLKIQGLMTIGAFLPEAEQVRPCFIKLKRLSEQIAELKLPNVEMKYLSMGMTSDFEIAVEEGANLLRIGTAIFGERK